MYRNATGRPPASLAAADISDHSRTRCRHYLRLPIECRYFTGMSKPSKHIRPVNGRVLWKARDALGLTQAQMAARILLTDDDPYMDDSRLSKIELGKAPWPSQRMRAALARAYEITAEQLTAPC